MADRHGGTFYPIALRLRGRRVLIVGGGAVALRKAAGLLAAGARVVAISPAFSPAFRRLARSGRVACVRRPYRPGDLAGMALVVAATDDAEVNAQVSVDAKRTGVLANVVDSLEESDFIVPAVVRRGDLLVAVSTGGASPGLAGRLRHEFEALVPREYAALLDLLRLARKRVQRAVMDGAQRRQVIRRLLGADLLAALRTGGRAAALRQIDALLVDASSEPARGLRARGRAGRETSRRQGLARHPEPEVRARIAPTSDSRRSVGGRGRSAAWVSGTRGGR